MVPIVANMPRHRILQESVEVTVCFTAHSQVNSQSLSSETAAIRLSVQYLAGSVEKAMHITYVEVVIASCLRIVS